MIRLSFNVAIVVFSLACAFPAQAATVSLPAGTKVTVNLINGVNSGSATAGQAFSFQAAAPVAVAGRVLIAQGARGVGRVAKATKAHGKSAGELTLQFTSIHAVDGTPVRLTEASSSKGSPEKGKASTATIAATVALGPLGLFAHNMVKGKDVFIKPSQTFPAWVKSNTPIRVH
ncbi:MAG: hypothetical protein JO018_04955 [Candidatus Eremiobacteraeota bacterium]|nr:hypothetical protein [Candidatus Eremiobacteraeota bacterium]